MEIISLGTLLNTLDVESIADIVILAAGGFSTPVILQNSGIECESTLFVDPDFTQEFIKNTPAMLYTWRLSCGKYDAFTRAGIGRD